MRWSAGKQRGGSRTGQREKLTCVARPVNDLLTARGYRARMTFLSGPDLAQGGQACLVSHQSVMECGLALEVILKGLITKKHLSAYSTPVRRRDSFH